ncbi:MAG: transglutaminase-like cysteine peptidase [Desulfobacteraceae bacterium]|jgi:predicted transglutaminase-like cysteine proteinase|nr:transglutaminase-like cysteine peptidase [Desulfobacteraceae bacterium]
MSNLVDATSVIIQLVLSRRVPVLNFVNNTMLLPLGIVLSLFFFVGHIVSASGNFTLDSSVLNAAEKEYGVGARKRLVAWQQFVREDTSRTDMEKLEKVNSFFNQVNFVSDAIHWSKKDYWATPVEFLASDGGDCEDFALSKYFTLKMLGVPEKKLNLTYVKAWKLNQSHMVLTYYKTPDAVPLVLDNLINAIKPATQRPDLLPVYSFNGSGLWLSKERGRGNLVGKSDRLKLWNDLLERMPVSLQ